MSCLQENDKEDKAVFEVKKAEKKSPYVGKKNNKLTMAKKSDF